MRAAARAVEAALVGDVSFAAEDRLDAGLFGALVEVDRAEEIAVLGRGHRRHAEVLHAGTQVGHVDGAVEEAVLSMEMQVDEIGHILWSTVDRPLWTVADQRGPDH